MKARTPRGVVYRCPVCGAEVSVLSGRCGAFAPRCCNVDMVPQLYKLMLYVCPRCGAEIGVVRKGSGAFAPRCCNTAMVFEAA